MSKLNALARRPTRLTAWLVVAAVLLAGGALLGVRLTGANGAKPLSTSPVSSAKATGQASGRSSMGVDALLSAALGTQMSPSSADLGSPAGRHERLLRLRLRLLLLGGLHGQVTFATKNGPKTVAFQRGVIQSRSTSSVVVKSADGMVMTWDLVAKTAVRHAGHRVGVNALAVGQRVFVIGQVAGTDDDARLILIRRPRGSG